MYDRGNKDELAWFIIYQSGSWMVLETNIEFLIKAALFRIFAIFCLYTPLWLCCASLFSKCSCPYECLIRVNVESSAHLRKNILWVSSFSFSEYSNFTRAMIAKAEISELIITANYYKGHCWHTMLFNNLHFNLHFSWRLWRIERGYIKK